MRILALEPYYGGSHRRFMDGWSLHSRNDWRLLTLPAHSWKWRMRHAAVTLAEKSAEIPKRSGLPPFDAIVASDMLNLAEFLGLAPPRFRSLPVVLYFHENQLTYPDRNPDSRDGHFAYTNITSALAATSVWFNSRFHLDSFLTGARSFLRRMPDHQHVEQVDAIGRKSIVIPPGIDPVSANRRPESPDGPLTILWAARWEHDKNPGLFYAAIRELKQRADLPFRLIVVGQNFRDRPRAFDQIEHEFAEDLLHFGYAESRPEYERLVAAADVILSTAKHEFFGLSVVEAISAGVHPLLPDNLAYPEVIERCIQGRTSDPREAECVRDIDRDEFFHDSTASGIADRLLEFINRKQFNGSAWRHPAWRRHCAGAAISQFGWKTLVRRMDDAIESIETF